MKFAAALFLTLAAFAQDMSEIHGTVAEYGTNAPIAAAEVILDEFVTIDSASTKREGVIRMPPS